jgi:hypothetical protein
MSSTRPWRLTPENETWDTFHAAAGVAKADDVLIIRHTYKTLQARCGRSPGGIRIAVTRSTQMRPAYRPATNPSLCSPPPPKAVAATRKIRAF